MQKTWFDELVALADATFSIFFKYRTTKWLYDEYRTGSDSPTQNTINVVLLLFTYMYLYLSPYLFLSPATTIMCLWVVQHLLLSVQPALPMGPWDTSLSCSLSNCTSLWSLLTSGEIRVEVLLLTADDLSYFLLGKQKLWCMYILWYGCNVCLTWPGPSKLE